MSSIPNATKKLIDFDATELGYPEWRLAALSLGLSIPAGGPHGMIPFMVPAAEQVTLLGASAREWRPFVDPGPEPIFTGRATAEQTSINQQTFMLWEKKYAIYSKQQEAKRSMAQEMINSLDSATIQSLISPIHGTLHLTCDGIIASLDERFLNASAATFKKYKTMMKTPFVPGSSIPKLQPEHSRCHRYFLSIKSPMSEAEKVDVLKDCLDGASAYSEVLKQFTRDFHDVNKQKFDELSKRLTVEYDNFSTTTVTSTSSLTARDVGYSANSASSTFVTREELAALITGFTGIAKSSVPSHAPAKQQLVVRYCWSHGMCGHSSDQCKSKKPGHIDAATSSNKMGGSTYDYKRPV